MSRKSTRRLGTVSLALLVVLVPAAWADTALDRFEAAYELVLEEVESGTLEPGAAAAAEAARFEVEKERIRAAAEIEILRLEAARRDGDELDEVLDRLETQAARREAAAWSGLVKLLGLLDGVPSETLDTGAGEVAPPPATAVSAEPSETESPSDEVTLEISFEPEEFVDDPPP